MVITLVLYWPAYSYADLAGVRLRSGGRLTARGLLATMLRELPILIGAAIPLATLLLCWIAGTGLFRRRPRGGGDLGRNRPRQRARAGLRGPLARRPATPSPAAARRRLPHHGHDTAHRASPDRASPNYQASVPGGPLNGPINSEVIQPP